jgi:peptide-methionine (S)-S-oxide reductase
MEAVFQFVQGVLLVEQGWISKQKEPDKYFEAVRIQFDPSIISSEELVEIHLATHQSSNQHGLSARYPSSIYTMNQEQFDKLSMNLILKKEGPERSIITTVEILAEFKSSLPRYHNYFISNPEKPFCNLYIRPKLERLNHLFPHLVKSSLSNYLNIY